MDILRTYSCQGYTLEIAALEPEMAPTSPPLANLCAPGAGQFELGAVQLSASTLSPGQSTMATMPIENNAKIGYVFFELFLYDVERGQAYGPVMRNYLQAPGYHRVSGVKIPEWKALKVAAYKFLPGLVVLQDGEHGAFGFLSPERYGMPRRDAINQVHGFLTFAETGAKRRATVQFRGGRLRDVLVQGGAGLVGAMRSYAPLRGDQFTPYVSILSQNEHVWRESRGQSNSLNIGERSLRLLESPLIPGTYLAGFAVQDLDGKLHRRFASLTVIE